MRKPKVSIVVPIYNGEKYLDNCIKNLKSQTYDNLEFVLVDDGSTDSTGKMCDDIAGKDDRFKVIHKENGGPSSSRNAGIMASSGDYIQFYDVDDEMDEKLVEDNLKLAIDPRNDADVVIFSFWYHDLDTGKRWNNAEHGFFCGTDSEFFDKEFTSVVQREIFNAPWNKLYKRSFLTENNLEFLPEFSIYEDAVFSAMMLQRARKIVFNDKPYYEYYVRSEGSLITRYVDCYFDAVTRLFEEAMKYCEGYCDNQRQIEAFSELYVKLVTTNLKQISCNSQLSYREKDEKILSICDSKCLQKAFRTAKLEPRKSVVRHFIFRRNSKAICTMYRVLGKINE